MSSGLAILLRIIGLGAVLAAVSEIWFYPVTLSAHLMELCVFYGLLGYVAWLLMAACGVRTWRGAFWGACCFGFFIEGIPVPVLYEAVPFTILWTSIAWHAIISVALGLWGLRWVSARKGAAAQIAAFTLAGLYLGGWSVELWSLRDDNSLWVWTPTSAVALQFGAGWVMLVAGHLALDGASRLSAVPRRWELPVFGALTAVLFGVSMLLAVFPVSLILPVLVALCVVVMARDGAGSAPRRAPHRFWFACRICGSLSCHTCGQGWSRFRRSPPMTCWPAQTSNWNPRQFISCGPV